MEILPIFLRLLYSFLQLTKVAGTVKIAKKNCVRTVPNVFRTDSQAKEKAPPKGGAYALINVWLLNGQLFPISS